MSERANSAFLGDIREALARVMAYTAGMTYEAFEADTKTQDAVIRNPEILGEAANNISEETRSQFPGIPWRSMAGARDRLIHHYFGVNLDIVWEIVSDELPAVADQLPDSDETD